MTNAATTTTPTTEDAPVLTREQKLRKKYDNLVKMIEQYTEKANEIATELNTLAALDSIVAGSEVTVRLGRAETTRYEKAVVLAVKEDEDGGKTFKVQYGAGFDTEIAVVPASKISVPEPEAVEAGTES